MKAPAKRRARRPPTNTLGWREWAVLPELGVRAIKVKLDTGARTSSLQASGLKRFFRDDTPMVRFVVHPVQRSSVAKVEIEAEVVDERVVRSSGGHEELRPVIQTVVHIGDHTWPLELTLARRDQMGFRMLLGRQALKNRVVVDAGSSFRAGRSLAPVNQARRTRRASEDEE